MPLKTVCNDRWNPCKCNSLGSLDLAGHPASSQESGYGTGILHYIPIHILHHPNKTGILVAARIFVKKTVNVRQIDEKMGFGEMIRSFSKRTFVRALQRLIPELDSVDVHPGGAGVRAQALEPTGTLVDDFRIVEVERMIHVLNAPSPAATAAISIGKKIAAMAGKNFHL